jgi:hypothetical protein
VPPTLPPGLLRRHICDGAYYTAGTGEVLVFSFPGGKRCLVGACASLWADLREPKVKNFGVFALGDENICRLDIPMDDASIVGGIERVGDLNSQREYVVNLHRLARNPVLQG